MKRVFGIALTICSLSWLLACQEGKLSVDTITPKQGTTGGGDEVTLSGSGFRPGKTQAEVRFGRKKAESVIVAASNKIKVLTPAGDKGAVDITVIFDDGQAYKIAEGFTYVEPASTGGARKAFFSGKQE